MKSILCLFFGLFVAALGVYGQVSRDTLSLPKTAIGWQRVPPVINLTLKTGRQVRVMPPDHMPCVGPDLALVQRMPVQRMKSTDPMPNGVQQSGEEKIPDWGPVLRRGKP